jgi:putative transposase
VVDRFNWVCHAYCLMADHYHLVVETPDANLSKGMRQLNGVFTQATNRRYGRAGHLFHGRFKGILVDKDRYLIELARYVVLSPVRARIIEQPGNWPWSSYRAMVGDTPTPKWLATRWLLTRFGSRKGVARRRFREFVLEGLDTGSIWSGLRQQIYLGDDEFVVRMQEKMEIKGDELAIPKVQRRAPAAPLEVIAKSHPGRDEAIAAAYATGAYGYREIAAFFKIHPATVGRAVRRANR